MEPARSRIAWVDIVRGIGIILVVLGHTYRDNSVLIWITSFHMPLFFILSGWLVGNRQCSINAEIFFAKVKSFLVPLTEFIFITYLYWILVESRFRSFDIGPMWFLAVLFIVEIVAAILCRYCNKICISIGTILMILGVICVSYKSISVNTSLIWLPRIFGGGPFI